MKDCERMVLTVLALTAVVRAQSNIDPAHKLAWGENVGWTNWRDADAGTSGVSIGATFLQGFLWGENIGWINVGDGTPGGLCDGQPCYANLNNSDFGINANAKGLLHGLAWSENVGWIKFDVMSLDADPARLDFCRRRLFGLAWGENIGWINLNNANAFVGVGPCAVDDFDCDGNVTTHDYAAFPKLMSGPGNYVGCPPFDEDGDGDIDLFDFAAFQGRFMK